LDFLDLEEFRMYMELKLVSKSSPYVFEIESLGLIQGLEMLSFMIEK
jgi:hypothetical protein